MFSGRGPPDLHIFLSNKIGVSEAIQKKLEWKNLIFFAA
jgi:hypothetical protein